MKTTLSGACNLSITLNSKKMKRTKHILVEVSYRDIETVEFRLFTEDLAYKMYREENGFVQHLRGTNYVTLSWKHLEDFYIYDFICDDVETAKDVYGAIECNRPF